MTRVIYVSPMFDFEKDWFKGLSDEEKLHFARNESEMDVYALDEFEKAFNAELISDLGYIYFV